MTEDTTNLSNSELWGKLTSNKRLPGKTIVNQSSMFEVNEQANGVWVRILMAESMTRTLTHNVLHMQLDFGRDGESVRGRAQDDYEDERQQQRQDDENKDRKEAKEE
jgi:hypothetical protein